MTNQLIFIYTLTFICFLIRLYYLKKYFKYSFYDAFERSLCDSFVFGILSILFVIILINLNILNYDNKQ